VTLVVKRKEVPEPLTFTARRELIVPDTVKATVENGIAALHVSSFNQRTAAAVEHAILKAKDDSGGTLKGIIIDFRSDPGGLLDQAVDMASLFLDSGTITPLLKRMEALGLVRRERDRTDERRVIVRLSEAGRDLRARAVTVPATMSRGQDAGQLDALRETISGLVAVLAEAQALR
jgi:C-terminal processing protease CtpA/Prc